jgi:hypothetical protein
MKGRKKQTEEKTKIQRKRQIHKEGRKGKNERKKQTQKEINT